MDSNYYNRFKKIIPAMILCSVVAPLIIHILFKWHSRIDFIEAEWTAGEILQYIGTLLSSAGTIFLAYLALQESSKANCLSEKVMQLEQHQYELYLRPFVRVTNWSVYTLHKSQTISSPTKKYIKIDSNNSDTLLALEIELTNTTESCISVEYGRGYHDSAHPQYSDWENSSDMQSNLKMMLSPKEKDTFVFCASCEFLKQQVLKKTTIELFLENRFSKKYKETFILIIEQLCDLSNLEPNKWYCLVSAQEYALYHQDKNEEGKPTWIQDAL